MQKSKFLEFKIVFFTLCLMGMSSFIFPQNLLAASFNRDAASVEYEKGQLQQSKAIQELEAGSVDDLDDYDTLPTASIADPLEPWNRFWFGFNDIFYLHIARPAYNAYDFVMPDAVQGGLSNFFSNLLFPIRFVNSLLQGKFQHAGVEFSRFFVNTTVGLGGFIDVAKHKKTVVDVDATGEDFGQTLGVWGSGHGFYIVWPFIGPSTARDTIGMAADYCLDPLFYLETGVAIAAAEGGLHFNDLGYVLPLYEDMKDLSVDQYVAMREAYVAFRKVQVQR